jgi:hypothetical protein
MTPYRVAFGQECLLPIELTHESWRVITWQAIESSDNPRAELLALRARQLERRPEDLQQTAESQRRSREANRKYFDKNRRQRPESGHHIIGLGDWVLLHDTKLELSHSHKLSERWTWPYKVIDVGNKEDRGTYRLAELDGMELEGFYAGDRVKKFVIRELFS